MLFHGYLHYTLSYNPTPVDFLLFKYFQLWSVGALSAGSCVPLTQGPTFRLHITSYLRLVHFPKKLMLFFLENDIKTKI